MITCAMHVHSTWSDGEMDLAELRRTYAAAGVQAVLMADHDIAFADDAALVAYVADCARHSDGALRFIPGVEFTGPDRMHIVGFGVTTLAPSSDPEAIFAHIRTRGGVGMIAHPRDAHFAMIEAFGALPDGVEVWNSKYDGKHGPRARTFELFHRLRARVPSLRAFYGQDLHWRTQNRELLCRVVAPDNSADAILEALRSGAYEATMRGEVFPSDGVVPSARLEAMDARQRRAARAYGLLKSAKALAGPLARLVPPALKAQLRRFF